jgi:hypothetical protein
MRAWLSKTFVFITAHTSLVLRACGVWGGDVGKSGVREFMRSDPIGYGYMDTIEIPRNMFSALLGYY